MEIETNIGNTNDEEKCLSENEGIKDFKVLMGNRIQMLRKKKHLSTTELAERIREKTVSIDGYDTMEKGTKLTRNTVCRWEKGDFVPSSLHFACLLDILGCSADYLIGLDDIAMNSEAEQGFEIKHAVIRDDEKVLYHSRPVFIGDGNWGIYNNDTRQVTLMDGSFVDVNDTTLYSYPDKYLFLFRRKNKLDLEDAKACDKVWIELIHDDWDVRKAYRGWYTYNSETHCFEGKTLFHEKKYGELYVAIKR